MIHSFISLLGTHNKTHSLVLMETRLYIVISIESRNKLTKQLLQVTIIVGWLIFRMYWTPFVIYNKINECSPAANWLIFSMRPSYPGVYESGFIHGIHAGVRGCQLFGWRRSGAAALCWVHTARSWGNDERQELSGELARETSCRGRRMKTRWCRERWKSSKNSVRLLLFSTQFDF